MFTSIKRRLFGSANTATPDLMAVPQASPSEAVDEVAALRQRGNSLLQQGKLTEAVQCYRDALNGAPDDVGALVNLGYVLNELEQFAQASPFLERAVEVAPTNEDALYLSGITRLSLGDTARAIARFREALSVRPDLEACRRDLCLAHVRLGDYTAAGAVAAQGIALNPQAVELHQIMGNLQSHAGALKQATSSYRTALSLMPNAAHIHTNLGKVLQEQGELTEAITCYQRALELEPRFIEAMLGMGAAQQKQGLLDAAVQSYERALAMAPEHTEVLSNLGAALTELRKLPEARDVLTRVLRLDPNHTGAHVNLGIVLNDQGELAAAIASYRRALALDPDIALAHSNLGGVFQELGEHDEAISSYRKALALDPRLAGAQSNLLFTLNYHPHKTAEEIYADYREYDERVGGPLRSTWREYANSRDLSKRLKVGYVSPDFRLHSVRHFLEPLLAHHDKRAVELFAYAELSKEDAVTARYRACVDHWITTTGMSDEALADRIRSDGIDVLLDLAGHTAKNRLGTFARKPAPVSLSWLGYGYTTGLSAIDYMLTDAAGAPLGSESLFAEKPWRLDTPGYVYRPAEVMGDVSALPALDRGFVTFGTLTRSVRINHRTVRAWTQVLHRVPASRLIVDSKSYQDLGLRKVLHDKFSAHGIGPERL